MNVYTYIYIYVYVCIYVYISYLEESMDATSWWLGTATPPEKGKGSQPEARTYI